MGRSVSGSVAAPALPIASVASRIARCFAFEIGYSLAAKVLKPSRNAVKAKSSTRSVHTTPSDF